MFLFDVPYILNWWIIFFLIGIIFLPLTFSIFSNFFDRGYIFSRILGIAVLSYVVFLLGVLKFLPFQIPTIIFVCVMSLTVNLFITKKTQFLSKLNLKENWGIYFLEEAIFLAALLFWSYIRAFQPNIHGLEKFMDFGFVNSILRADYFPPRDMWFTPFPINYYYFGHLVTALLTKISQIPSFITYNLMLATLFALTFTASFSIGLNLLHQFKIKNLKFKIILGGLLTAFLVTMGGNIHSIYSFFTPYTNGTPVPFWQLIFSPQSFPNTYWYPNATRFIFNTIHEFPIYSFVVSDLHGHVLDIPFVLLTIAILLSMFFGSTKNHEQTQNSKVKIWQKFAICDLRFAILLAFMLAIMYMTNVWDAIIYFLLVSFIVFFIKPKSGIYMSLLFLIGGAFLFSLPFSKNFTPFASGIGILCAPKFLTDVGHLGPFLFEPDHCQKSPLWQLSILYGFFYFWVIVFFLSFIKNWKLKIKNLSQSDIFVLILIFLSTLLIIIPEFVYLKDIYPAHYRANTMFKLVYQSFIMLSISSGYIVTKLIFNFQFKIFNLKKGIFFIFAFLFLILVMVYPYFAINSYYAGLNSYKGLNGTAYLNSLYPNDYQAIQWINKNIKGQPVILEAQGDSYTDYARISTNTGLPTVLGWTVHEWLWRGTYDIPAPRINDVSTLYESKDLPITKEFLAKYNIAYVYVGELERKKYLYLNEDKFKQLGKVAYSNGNVTIYKLNY